jgi:hypothetical protein
MKTGGLEFGPTLTQVLETDLILSSKGQVSNGLDYGSASHWAHTSDTLF